MKIKWDLMMCMIFFLLLSEVAGCDSSYNEMRLISRKNVRDATRNFDRFGSLERIRLRSYRTLDSRKFPSISYSKIHTNEAGSAIKVAPQNLNSLHLNRIVLNRENPTLERISNLRLGSRLIGERQRESSARLRNVITKEHLSNIDINTEESTKKVTHLTRGYNRNDRRVTNGIENRFSLQIRENRLREKLRSRRSIIPPQYNTERRTTIMSVRNANSANIPQVSVNDASEIWQPLISSKKDQVLKVLNRDANRRYVNQQRRDKREIIQMKSRYNTRNTRSSKSIESFSKLEFHKKQSELRRERNFLVSRRELKIPDGERIRSEDSRQVRRYVRSGIVRDKNIEETTQNRRNGRGFRGRMDKRSAVDERREKLVRIKVPFLNQRIEFSYQNTSNAGSIMRKTQRFLMYRVTKVSGHRHFSHTGTENSLSDLKYNRVSRVINDFGKSIGQNSDAQLPRGIRKTGKRARFSILNRVRRFTVRMENSAMARNTLNEERRSLPYRLETELHTLVNEANKQEARFPAREHNKAIQNRERHTQTTSVRKLSVRDTNNKKQLVRNLDNSLSSLSPTRFSNQVRDRRVHAASRQITNDIVRNRRVGDRMRSITRRLRVQPKSVIRLLVTQFLCQITNNFHRFDGNSRSIDAPNRISFSNHLKNEVYSQQLNAREIFHNRHVAVSRQREMVGKHRGILNKQFRCANENYNPVRIRLNTSDFSNNDMKNARNIQERALRRSHRNKEVIVISKTFAKIESFTTIRIQNNFRTSRNTDVRFKNRRLLTRSSRIVASYAPKSHGFIKSNTSEELYIPENSFTKDLIRKMSFRDNSVRLYASQRVEQHGQQLPILKSFNQARGSLYEHLSQKKNCMLSFVLNVILGLAVIVAMSEDINKGFTSQLKNQLKHSIFKYLKV